MNERAFELLMRAPVRWVMFAMERRRRDRYLAWGVSPRYEEIKQ
jgi:hypothetical protein